MTTIIGNDSVRMSSNSGTPDALPPDVCTHWMSSPPDIFATECHIGFSLKSPDLVFHHPEGKVGFETIHLLRNYVVRLRVYQVGI